MVIPANTATDNILCYFFFYYFIFYFESLYGNRMMQNCSVCREIELNHATWRETWNVVMYGYRGMRCFERIQYFGAGRLSLTAQRRLKDESICFYPNFGRETFRLNLETLMDKPQKENIRSICYPKSRKLNGPFSPYGNMGPLLRPSDLLTSRILRFPGNVKTYYSRIERRTE